MGTIYLDGICYSSGGGGGGASSADQVSLDDTNLAYEADDVQEAFEKVTKSLTYAEYEALTDAEKNSGTIYLITDINGTGDKFQPVIYSAEEREIGVWEDGKPIYEKTVNIAQYSVIAVDTTWNDLFAISNIEYLVSAEAHGNSPNIGQNLRFQANNGYIQIASKTSINVSTLGTYYFTFSYTKTTDAAGSGTWTPQGVPAVHYSTDEHVVGTWIDDNTLYEKTFYSDMVIPYDSASAITLNDTIPSNIKVVDIQAYFRGNNASGNQVYQSDGGRWFHYYYESTENKIYAAQIFTSAGVTNCKTYFTLRYTKSST